LPGRHQVEIVILSLPRKQKKEDFEQLSSFLIETSDNEKEHTKRFFKFFESEHLEITTSFPAGIIASTPENLEAATRGENKEWSTLCPEFARTADTEGFTEIAKVFRNIARAEKQYEKTLSKPSEKY
jgi:rubrerythrin